MVDVSFKDLCLDAQEPDAVGPFWAGVLGLSDERLDDGDHRLSGERPEQTVWVNTVPEPQTVKNRVHLDVRFDDPTLPGVPVVDEQPHWTVRSDPEGLLFCAFGPREGAVPGPFELVVDCADPLALATWWGARTGATVHQREGEPWAWLEGSAGFPWPFWVFGRVPEPKTVKNRVHWDVRLEDATVEGLVAAGASVVRPRDDEIRWTVMADPEGNEFCAFAAD
jgi:hypothetical protein